MMYILNGILLYAVVMSTVTAQATTNKSVKALGLYNSNNKQITSMLKKEILTINSRIKKINQIESTLYQQPSMANDLQKRLATQELYRKLKEQYSVTAGNIQTLLHHIQTQKGTANMLFSDVKAMFARNRKLEAQPRYRNLPNPVPPKRKVVAPAPPVIQTAPSVVQTAPPIVQTAPPIVQTAPPIVQTAPPIVQTAPPIVQTPPTIVQTAPPVIQTAPSIVRTAPPIIQTAPPIVRTAPPMVRTAPPIVQTAPLLMQTAPTVVQTVEPVTSAGHTRTQTAQSVLTPGQIATNLVQSVISRGMKAVQTAQATVNKMVSTQAVAPTAKQQLFSTAAKALASTAQAAGHNYGQTHGQTLTPVQVLIPKHASLATAQPNAERFVKVHPSAKITPPHGSPQVSRHRIAKTSYLPVQVLVPSHTLHNIHSRPHSHPAHNPTSKSKPEVPEPESTRNQVLLGVIRRLLLALYRRQH